MGSAAGLRLKQQTFVVDKRTVVKPKEKRKPSTNHDIETVSLDSDDENELEDDDEIRFTGSSSPAKVQDRRISLRKKDKMRSNDFYSHSRHKPTIQGGSRKPQHGQPIGPADPEGYDTYKSKKKTASPYDYAGADNLAGPSSAPSNALQSSGQRRQHPQNDFNGNRKSSAMPSFAREKAAAALNVVNTQHKRPGPVLQAQNSGPVNVQPVSTRKPPSSSNTGQGSSASYKTQPKTINIKGVSQVNAKGKQKEAIEIDDDGSEDEIQDADANNWEERPSTSKVSKNASAQKVIKPGVVKEARSRFEGSQANQVHSSPLHGATDQEDEIGIPAPKRPNKVANMQAKSTGIDQMGAPPKTIKQAKLQQHLLIKSAVSEAGTHSNMRLIVDPKGSLVLSGLQNDKVMHFSRGDLYKVQLTDSNSAKIKQDTFAFAVITISDSGLFKVLGLDDAFQDLHLFMEFDKEHDWDEKVYIQLVDLLKGSMSSGPTPIVDLIRCEAFKAQREQALHMLRFKGPIKSNLPSQDSVQHLTLSGKAAQARRDQAAEKDGPRVPHSAKATLPLRPERPREKNKVDTYVELSDGEVEKSGASSSEDDLKAPARKVGRPTKKDSSREASGEVSTRPAKTRPKARPSAGARRCDSERNGEDSDSVEVAPSRINKTRKQEDYATIEDGDFYESKGGRASKSKDDAAFKSTAKATTDGTSRVTRRQGEGDDRRSISAPPSKPKEKWKPISEGPEDQVVLVHPPEGAGSISITKGDFDRLQPDEYLNDTLVEFGMKQVWEKLANGDAAERELADQIHIFSSFFYKKLSAKSASKDKNKTPVDAYMTVRKWTAKFDLFSKKYVFLPINENFHWYLAVIINPGAVLRRPVQQVDADADSAMQPSDSLKAAIAPSEQAGRVTSPYFAKGCTEAEINETSAGIPMVIDDTAMDIDEPAHSAVKSKTRSSEAPKAEVGVDEAMESRQKLDAPEETAVPENNVAKPTVTRTAASVGSVTQATEGDDDMCYIITLDSLAGKHKAVHDKLRTYLKREAVDKNKAIDEDHVYVDRSNVTAINGNCSEQHNFSDCGLYVMHFTEKLLESREDIVPFLTHNKIPLTATNQKPKGRLQEEEMVNELWAREDAMTRRVSLANDIRKLSHLWTEAREKQMLEKRAKRQARLKAGEGQSGTEGEGAKAADDFTSTSEEEGGDSDVEIVEKAKTPSPVKRPKKLKKKTIQQSESSEGESDPGPDIKVPAQFRRRSPSIPKAKSNTSHVVVEVLTRPPEASSVPKPSLSQQTAKAKAQRSASPVKAAAAAPSVVLDDEQDELESSPAPVRASQTAMEIDIPPVEDPLAKGTSQMSLDTEPSGSEGVEEEEEDEGIPKQPSESKRLPAETSATTVSASSSTSTSGTTSSSTSDDEQDVSALTDGDSSTFPHQVISPAKQVPSRSQSPSKAAKIPQSFQSLIKAPSLPRPSQSPSTLRKLVDDPATYMPGSSSLDDDAELGLSSLADSVKVPLDRKNQKRARNSSLEAHADIGELVNEALNVERPTRKRSRQDSPSRLNLTFADKAINNRKASTSPAPRVSSTTSSSPQTFHTPNGGTGFNKDQPIDLGDSEEDTAQPAVVPRSSNPLSAKRAQKETSSSLLESVGRINPGLSGELKRSSEAGFAVLQSLPSRSNSNSTTSRGLQSPTHIRFNKD